MQEVVPQKIRRGKVTNIKGPMFSGKSTELMRLVRRLRKAGKKCYVLKHIIDARFSGQNLLESHDNITMDADRYHSLEEVPEEVILENDVIAIDEGQFFTGLTSTIEKWTLLGKDVIVAGLNLSFERKYYSEMILLEEISDYIIHLTAICHCGQEAAFTHRRGDSKELILIGGNEEYEALCSSCFPYSDSV